jgi:S1-C subfamily serine protease
MVDPSGYIMTNAHVIQGAVSIKVLVGKPNIFSGVATPRFQSPRTFEARVLGVDRESDLALLKIDGWGAHVRHRAQSRKGSTGSGDPNFPQPETVASF